MTHRESQDWIRTIEENKGYSAIDPAAYRRLLGRMEGYAIYRALERHVKPEQTVLEAGCGWALASFALAAKGRKVTAIDISAKLIADLQDLQRRLDGTYASNLELIAEDIFRLPAMQKTFDVVCSDGTYEHFPDDHDRSTVLQNFRAVLKPGGTLFIAVPNLGNPFFGSVVDQKMPTMHFFTLRSLEEELRKGGFRIIETGYSFVNPGFEQWVKSRWMIGVIRVANGIFRFLPRCIKRIVAAHIFCVAQK